MNNNLYYNIVIRENYLNNYYQMYNEGFIIVNIDDERIVSIEGILTCDYIRAYMVDEKKLVMQYFVYQGNFILEEEFRIIIPKKRLEIPIDLRGNTDDGDIIEIKTTRRVDDYSEKKKYEKKLKDFKENHIFKEER